MRPPLALLARSRARARAVEEERRLEVDVELDVPVRLGDVVDRRRGAAAPRRDGRARTSSPSSRRARATSGIVRARCPTGRPLPRRAPDRRARRRPARRRPRADRPRARGRPPPAKARATSRPMPPPHRSRCTPLPLEARPRGRSAIRASSRCARCSRRRAPSRGPGASESSIAAVDDSAAGSRPGSTRSGRGRDGSTRA